MTNKKLEYIMRNEWQKVLKDFNYPKIPEPTFTGYTNKLGSMQFALPRIVVSWPWVERLDNQYEIPFEESINGILSHELVHFTKYPGSLQNSFKLNLIAKDIIGFKVGNKIVSNFTEVQTVLYTIQEMKHSSIIKIEKAIKNDMNSYQLCLIHKLCEEISGEKLGFGLDEEGMEVIKELKKLDYLSKEKEVENLKFFIKAILYNFSNFLLASI